MENAANENQPQPQTGCCIKYSFEVMMCTIAVLGLSIGPLIYYAENSVMGSLCSAPIYFGFLPLSIYLQTVPLAVVVNAALLQLLPFKVEVKLQGFGFLLFQSMHLVCMALHGAICLGITLAFTNICTGENASISSSGPYIIFWIVTAFNLLFLLLILFIIILRLYEFLKDRRRFCSEWGLGPWFDRKKRARVLQQLVRCAGTKEGCRLLANKYCGELFRWTDVFNHPIVLEYIWKVLEVPNTDLPSHLASGRCKSCEEILTKRDKILRFDKGHLKPEYYHLSCAHRWSLPQLNKIFPFPRKLMTSLEALAPEVDL